MTNKPSILIVCPNPPWRIGGVEKHVGEIARICRKKHKMEITIYCSSPDKEETGLSVWNDVPVRVFKRTEVFPYWPSGLFQAIKAVKGSGNFDLIHIQGIRSLEPLLTVLGNRGGIPYCITPHFHPVATNIFFSLVKNIFDPLLVKRIFANSKKIICVSETEEQLLIVSFGKEIRLKTQIVGNGIDLSNVRLNPRKPRQNPIVLMYVGRIEKYKNIDVAIKTMKKLGDGFMLRIIGDGPYRRELQKLVTSMGLRNVIFYGFLDNETLVEHLNECDILINFSKIEAFGISVLEALAAGKPAIVNNKLGLIELARKFPQAVFPLDCEKASLDEITKTIENALAAEVNIDLSNYKWEHVAKRMTRIYTEISLD